MLKDYSDITGADWLSIDLLIIFAINHLLFKMSQNCNKGSSSFSSPKWPFQIAEFAEPKSPKLKDSQKSSKFYI